jgi:type I restriction enzyme S subunit
LGSLFSFLSTGNNSRSELISHGEIGYLHYGDIHTKFHNFINCQTAILPYLPKSKVRGLSLLHEGDLIISDASEDYEGVGKSIEVRSVGNRKIVAGLHTHLLRGDKTVVVDGFKGYLPLMPKTRRFLQQMATGVTVYGLSKNNIKEAPVDLPPPDEQRAIARILSSMDTEITALSAQITKTEALKQGLMQDLLTGTIRLTKAHSLFIA